MYKISSYLKKFNNSNNPTLLKFKKKNKLKIDNLIMNL